MPYEDATEMVEAYGEHAASPTWHVAPLCSMLTYVLCLTIDFLLKFIIIGPCITAQRRVVWPDAVSVRSRW